MPLVRQVGEADIAGELPANNVPVVVDDRNDRSCGLEVRLKVSRIRSLRYWRWRTIGYLGRRRRPRRRRSGAGDTVCSYNERRISLCTFEQEYISQ